MEFIKKIISFLSEVKMEINKVSWPDDKEVFRYTIIVVVVSIVVAVFLGGLDFIFTILLNKLII